MSTLASGKYSADEEAGGKGAWEEEEPEAEEPEEEEEQEDSGGGGLSYYYKRTVYISDTYLSQAIYQSYALFVMAIVLTIGGGLSYAAVDPDTTMIDGCWAAFTWIAAGVLGGEVCSFFCLFGRPKNQRKRIQLYLAFPPFRFFFYGGTRKTVTTPTFLSSSSSSPPSSSLVVVVVAV